MHGKSTTLHNSMSPVHQTWHTQIADCILMNCQIWYLSISSMWKYNCPVHNLKTYKVWYYKKISFLLVLDHCSFSVSNFGCFISRTHWLFALLVESPGPPVRLSLRLEKLDTNRTNFHKILYFKTSKICFQIQVWMNS